MLEDLGVGCFGRTNKCIVCPTSILWGGVPLFDSLAIQAEHVPSKVDAPAMQFGRDLVSLCFIRVNKLWNQIAALTSRKTPEAPRVI